MTPGYEALRSGAAVVRLPGRGLIYAHGRDRARLLHNLSTNEVKKMTPGAGAYAFLLAPQGRIQADLNLFCFPDHFLIDTEADLREKVPQLIRKYIIADQVELADAPLESFAVEGPASRKLIEALGGPVPETPWSHAAWGEYIVAAVSVTGQPGFRLFKPAEETDDLLAKLLAAGAVEATDEDARTVRIENGKPRFGDDIFETSLVQETQQMHAVSFNKGCYLGQEIVERVRARGHVNRKLVRVEIDAVQPPAQGAKLLAGEAEAGEITSAVLSPQSGKVAAMAYLRVPHDAAGTALQCEGAAARVL